MGAKSSGLSGVVLRVERRLGKPAVSGRYHRLPKTVEDDYELDRQAVLGSGYNGQVFKATAKPKGKQFAVKAFKLHGIDSERREELERECEIYLSLDHPHVARLVDVYEGKDELTLVMECMEGGELFQRVRERRHYTERDGADAAWQMLLALNYIHSHNVVHRDIKLENFLYESKGGDYLKLIDFGFSKIWRPNISTKMTLSCGTLSYVAPEVLGKSYTSQCDMWSLGVCMFIMLFGYMPFTGSEFIMQENIRAGRYRVKKDAWAAASEPAQDFVKSLMQVNPDTRLTAETALKHPWLLTRENNASSPLLMHAETLESMCKFAQASKFRRTCMIMMAWSLTAEDQASVRETFLKIDKDRKGTISLWEFKQAVEEHFHITDQEACSIFQSIDTSHDDEVHYTEFLAALMSSRIALHNDLLAASFHRFDTDNSGYITASDMKKVFGETFEGEKIERLLQEADVSNDGKVSWQEWLDYLHGGGAEPHHEEHAVRLIDFHIASSGKDLEQWMRRRIRQLSRAFSSHSGLSDAKRKLQKKCCTVS